MTAPPPDDAPLLRDARFQCICLVAFWLLADFLSGGLTAWLWRNL